MKNTAARLIAVACLASFLEAQRLDCAPYRISLPSVGSADVQVTPRGIYLHIKTLVGIPLVSLEGATGNITVKLNLERWIAYSPSNPLPSMLSAVAAHYSPLYAPEKITGDVGNTGIGILNVQDATCYAYGLAATALIPGTCDWDSDAALFNRNIVVDTVGLPRTLGREILHPWTSAQIVEAWFLILAS